MTSLKTDEKVLPVDERGRVRVSRDRREALLEEFESSGMSGAKFARLAGVKYPTFMYWLKQRREDGRSGATATGDRTPAISFVEALIGGTGGSGSMAGLTVELPGGARVRVESPLQLQLTAELLRMLRAGDRGC
jgi:transposase-like protein